MSAPINRRNFIQTSSLAATFGFMGFSANAFPSPAGIAEDRINVLGPREGYSPSIGSLVSMMDWMRFVVLRQVEGMRQKDLDYLLDDNANSIGAMLFHLAATDKWYQLHCFENMAPDEAFESPKFDKFRVAMELGDNGRAQIKGNDLEFYKDIMQSTREETYAAFAKRDDAWLMEVDDKFPWGPTNNYCKWFHVCEHESNHNGQIKLIKSRIA